MVSAGQIIEMPPDDYPGVEIFKESASLTTFLQKEDLDY